MSFEKVTVSISVSADLKKVWDCWTEPEYITQWVFASGDWCWPKASNDLRVGGKFSSRMEAKDGSFGFDFEGVYENIVPYQLIEYAMSDGRRVSVSFIQKGSDILVTETFDAETENPVEMQRGGWQAILNNFKKLAEQG